MIQPFVEQPASDAEDRDLVARVHHGSRDALEQLLTRHQPWIYNIALRMLYRREQAEDATQEILIKVMTKLSTFEQRSSFRTWLYRIALNHILNLKRERLERPGLDFERYSAALDRTPDLDLPDVNAVPADVQLLVDEARIGCTSGLLLCLSAEQRLVFILGDIFGVTDAVGAELLEISRENYRQKLARARRDLQSFVQDKCGLVNPANPCRCAKKTQGFIKLGYVDPQRLQFAQKHVLRVRDVAPSTLDGLVSLDAAYAAIHRDHPFHDPPDLVASLRQFIDGPEFKAILERH